MTHAEIIQLIGTFFVAMTGATALYIVANTLSWCSYGRLTLGVLAASQFAFVGDRAAFMLGLISAENTIVTSGMIAAVVTLIELNLVVMHRHWHRLGLAEPVDHKAATHAATALP